MDKRLKELKKVRDLFLIKKSESNKKHLTDILYELIIDSVEKCRTFIFINPHTSTNNGDEPAKKRLDMNKAIKFYWYFDRDCQVKNSAQNRRDQIKECALVKCGSIDIHLCILSIILANKLSEKILLDLTYNKYFLDLKKAHNYCRRGLAMTAHNESYTNKETNGKSSDDKDVQGINDNNSSTNNLSGNECISIDEGILPDKNNLLDKLDQIDKKSLINCQKINFLNKPDESVVIIQDIDNPLKEIQLKDYTCLSLIFFYIFLKKLSRAKDKEISDEIGFDQGKITKQWKNRWKEEPADILEKMKSFYYIHNIMFKNEIRFTPVLFTNEALKSFGIFDGKIRNYSGKNYAKNTSKYNTVRNLKKIFWKLYEDLRNIELKEKKKIAEKNRFQHKNFKFIFEILTNATNNIILIKNIEINPTNETT